MKKRIKKVFQGKYIDMLFAIETIVNSAKIFQTNLESRLTTLTMAHFAMLLNRIDDAYIMIGVDKYQPQREATDTVQTDSADIYAELSLIKRQLIRLYANDQKALDELLRTLGYTSFFSKAGPTRHKATIELCNHFSRNLSATIRADLETKGIPQLTFTKIINAADTLRDKNVTQENAKGSKMKLTEDNIIALNKLYNDVMLVADTGKEEFKNSRATFTQFSYTAVLKRLSNKRKAEDNGDDIDNTPDTSSEAPNTTPQA